MKVTKSALPPFARKFLEAQGYKGRKLFVYHKTDGRILDVGIDSCYSSVGVALCY
jgi:hypothetical protein